MSTDRFLIHVAAYLMPIKEDKVLLLHRFNTGWMDGKYSLIAGHLDGGESVSTAMVREAFEEAKIIVEKTDLIPATVIPRVSNVEYIDFFFVAEKWQGEPVIGEVHKCDDMRWFSLDELPDNLLPYIKMAINKYQNKTAFFESGWDNC